MGESDDGWREALRKRLEAGQTISGLARPLWPEPPIDARGLPAVDIPFKGSRPRGLMGTYVGQRLDVIAEAGPERLDYVGREALARVHAWPVLPLEGTSFRVERSQDIAASIRRVIGSALPGIDWWIPEYWDGPFEKYGFLHSAIAAPPNDATGEAMALELFGESDGAMAPGSDEWCAAMDEWARRGRVEADRPLGVRLPSTVRITVATYANILYPGIGVPFYG